MTRIEGEIIIDRPVEEVFDFVADERNEPRYNPRMLSAELLSGNPSVRVADSVRSSRRPVARCR